MSIAMTYAMILMKAMSIAMAYAMIVMYVYCYDVGYDTDEGYVYCYDVGYDTAVGYVYCYDVGYDTAVGYVYFYWYDVGYDTDVGLRYIFLLKVSVRDFAERSISLAVYGSGDRHNRHQVAYGHVIYNLCDHVYEPNERIIIWRDLEHESNMLQVGINNYVY